jgi:hypothetical protein
MMERGAPINLTVGSSGEAISKRNSAFRSATLPVVSKSKGTTRPALWVSRLFFLPVDVKSEVKVKVVYASNTKFGDNRCLTASEKIWVTTGPLQDLAFLRRDLSNARKYQANLSAPPLSL